MPSSGELAAFHVRTSEWFQSKSDYEAALENALVFFAPRPVEGIGFSFLEAMARGCCVVASDSPTMNEYITHGETGLLYNPRAPIPLDLSNARAMGENARRHVKSGHLAWLSRREELLNFIDGGRRSFRISFTNMIRQKFSLARYYLRRTNKQLSNLAKRLLGHHQTLHSCGA